MLLTSDKSVSPPDSTVCSAFFVSVYLNMKSGGSRRGFLVGAGIVLVAAVSLGLVDLHKRQLQRRKKRQLELQQHQQQHQQQQQGTMSDSSADPPPSQVQVKIAVASASAAGIPIGVTEPAMLVDLVDLVDLKSSVSLPEKLGKESRMRKQSQMSFCEQDDFIPPISLLNKQRSFVLMDDYDGMIGDDDDERDPRHKLLTLLSENGLADIEDAELDLDLCPQLNQDDDEDDDDQYGRYVAEMDFLDNITSCNKVENCVMLSEFEQNLSKEKEVEEEVATGWNRNRCDRMRGHFCSLYLDNGTLLNTSVVRTKNRSRRMKKWKIFGGGQDAKRGPDTAENERKISPIIEENSV